MRRLAGQADLAESLQNIRDQVDVFVTPQDMVKAQGGGDATRAKSAPLGAFLSKADSGVDTDRETLHELVEASLSAVHSGQADIGDVTAVFAALLNKTPQGSPAKKTGGGGVASTQQLADL